jgi:hypothetical protein
MEFLSVREQLVKLHEARDLLAQANRLIAMAGMGKLPDDGQEAHSPKFACEISCEIQYLLAKTTDALHSVSRARNGILQYVQHEHEQSARLAGSAEAK